MKPKRILHLVGIMTQRSGVTSVLMNFYRNINREKYQFDFLIYDNTEKHIINEIETLGGKVFIMPELSIRSIRTYIKNMNTFFEKYAIQYEIIHSHFHQVEAIVFPIAKKNGIRTCISHSHSTKYSDSKLKAIRNYLMCLPLNKNATHYFACSKDSGKFLFGRSKVEKGEVTIIKNAINCEKFRYNCKVRKDVRKQMQLKDEIVLGNVGSFKRLKNHIFLIDIFNELTKLNNNIKLVLVGDGELKNMIVNRINQYRIEDKVIFAGVTDNVAQYYQAFDGFIFPSIAEGFGIVLIEAQVSGLPIIASDVIPSEARITNEAEYLPLTLTPKEWAIKSLNLIEQTKRRDRYEEIKNANYDLQDETRRLAKIYDNLINRIDVVI